MKKLFTVAFLAVEVGVIFFAYTFLKYFGNFYVFVIVIDNGYEIFFTVDFFGFEYDKIKEK